MLNELEIKFLWRGPGGINYILTLDARGYVGLRNYTNRGGGSRSLPDRDHRAPIWLKLVRHGEIVTGYASTNGKLWREVGEMRPNKDLPELLYAGIMGTGFKEPATLAVLDQVRVTGAKDAEYWKPRIVLTDGTELTWPVASVDAADAVLEGDPPVKRVSRPLLARLQFVPHDALPDNLRRTGISLRNGDFVDGEIRTIRDGQVEISSVLFGIRRYELAREVAAVQFANPAPQPTAWTIDLTDGSQLRAQALTAKDSVLRVQSRLLPGLEFSAPEILGIRRAR